MRRYRITVGYDGTDFWGSQAQSGVRTVQGELNRLIERLARGSGPTHFAGRTDRGVHAVGQVVSANVNWAGTDEQLRDAFNALAPLDLVVRDVEHAPPAFHARYDALWREYRYRIVVAAVPPVLERRYVWWRRAKLDADLAREACGRFVGERAFGTFAGGGWSQSRETHTLVRTVRDCNWRVARGGSRHELRVVANGFLPQMVRNMVSAIVQVASGSQPAAWIDDLIAANDRRMLGDAAPPHGLTLWRVDYGDVEARGDLSETGVLFDEGYGEEQWQ